MSRTLHALLLVLFTAAVLDAATVNLELTSSLLYGSPGQTVSFTGTISNTGSTPAYINGDEFTSPLPLDDSPFLAGVPQVLPSGSMFSGPIFTVQLGFSVPMGLYAGSFTVIGGDDPGASVRLAMQPFAVQVVPEPATWQLIAGAIAVVLLVRPGQKARGGRSA